MKSKYLFLTCGVLLSVLICGALVVVAVLSISGGDDTARPPDPNVTVSPIPIAPSFEVIRQQHETMTEAQWKVYRTEIEGTQAIVWRGWVDEVTGNPGRFKMHVDMDAPDEFSVDEISFLVSDIVALDFQLDQEVTFTGEIDTATDFMGLLKIEMKRVSVK